MDTVTNRVYLSRHLVFYEQSLPAKERHNLLQLPSKINASFDAPFIVPISILVSSSFSLPHHTHHAATNSTHHASTESNNDHNTTTSPSDASSSPILAFEPLGTTNHHASFNSPSLASLMVEPSPTTPVATIAPTLHPMTTWSRTGSL